MEDKTAEQMLDDACIAFSAGEYAIDCDKAIATMDRYAKQQLIGVMTWAAKELLVYGGNDGTIIAPVGWGAIYDKFLHRNKPNL